VGGWVGGFDMEHKNVETLFTLNLAPTTNKSLHKANVL
jgi:hypothetical protein